MGWISKITVNNILIYEMRWICMIDKNIIDIAEKETMEVINEIRDDKNADILMLLVLSFAKGIKFGANGNERKIA